MTYKQIDFSKWLCRCSCISRMMANSSQNPPLTEKQEARVVELTQKGDKNGSLPPGQAIELAALLEKAERSKDVVLSDTCISYLSESYAWETRKMVSVSKEMDVEQLRRGKMTEGACIELLSFVNDKLYQKNTQRVSNEFLTGEPDIFQGEHIMASNEIWDTKSICDYPGFLYKMNTGPAAGNEDQVRGYADITGAAVLVVANCLVTAPLVMINDRKRKLMYQMDVVTDQDPEYLAAAAFLENSMTFDQIPAMQRVFKMPVEPFTSLQRQALYDRVKICRDWLNLFHDRCMSLNS